ncbi:glycosyltransferase family 4 protein [Actinomadura rudentiformis]|uniref:Glycosyltransferase family 4 protein n=1 Tax=Actinomadura rudentiformis TaxID=359158 RepID=A0A6H9Z642_9ACTN|nr:glycosyltransferase family 4 protein [Actinomadura rudentiformis]KAB2351569.1 glycosyltransferase family 4 protein [Actinomadura rudentiformis]
MRVCVCTIARHPEDARVLHRQIRALLDAGHEVTYIAPFRACNVTPWREITPVDVPQATGRRRLHAVRTAHRALAEHAAYADVVLLHDPELLISLPRSVRRRTVVWDVHEDTTVALTERGRLLRPVRPLLRPFVRRLEARTERRHRLLLAEDAHRTRFARAHPVVPNTAYVAAEPPAPPGPGRAVYVGRLSPGRGAHDMIELARLLAAAGVMVELIGPADPQVRPALRDAQREGILRWYGFVPNDRALRIAEGATAGLALLHDEPAEDRPVPAKVMEYMAHGVPVVTTPHPATVAVVKPAGSGIVVPFGDPRAAADAVLELSKDASLRTEMGKRAYETARARFHWAVHAEEFVSQLEAWAGRPSAAGLPCASLESG